MEFSATDLALGRMGAKIAGVLRGCYRTALTLPAEDRLRKGRSFRSSSFLIPKKNDENSPQLTSKFAQCSRIVEEWVMVALGKCRPCTRLRGVAVVELKPVNWAAAEELLERQPHRAVGDNHDAELERFARMHAQNGDRSFRLRTGLLDPDGPVAEAQRRYDRGEISGEEYSAAVGAYLRRPPDEALMEIYYANLSERADAVGMLLQRMIDRFDPSANVDLSWAIREAAAHLATAQAPPRLSRQELETADRFARGTRIEARISPSEFGPHYGLCAAALVRVVTRSFHVFLKPMLSKRIPTARLRALFDEWKSGAIPHANKLRSAIEHEREAVRMAFRKRAEDTAKPAASEVHITATLCSVNAERASVPAGVAGSVPGKAALVKLKVPLWSEFGIGVQGKVVLAFAKAPASGARVKLSSGTEVRMLSKHWTAILDLACSAGDGRTISKKQLLERLLDGKSPPPKYLTKSLVDFRRRLAKLVDGPADKSSLFRDEGRTIDLGITVRALFGGEGEPYTYGLPGHR